jgi:molybdopterin converting factor small subunit
MRINIELVGFLSSMGLSGGFRGGEVVMPSGANVSDVLEKIGVDQPVPWMITRNNELISITDPLEDGDLLKFIPPVSGG